MEPDSPRRRGRPARPTGNAMGQYLRSLREERGLTVRELARAVGLPESSASYISQLEAGLKVPNLELALQLAQALRDRQGIFRLWSLTSRRGDPHASSVALRELARLLGDPSIANDPHFVHPSRARIESAREAMTWRRDVRVIPDPPGASAMRAMRETGAMSEPGVEPSPMADEAVFLRRNLDDSGSLVVPVYPEGVDPEYPEGGRPIDQLRIDRAAMRALALHRPFAYRVTERTAQRVSSLLQPGDVVVLTEDDGPLLEHEVYAIRTDRDGVVLALAMWNGAHLLLLPGAGRTDFLVFEARNEGQLRRRIAGRVATVVRGGG